MPKNAEKRVHVSMTPAQRWVKASPSSWGNVSKKCWLSLAQVAGRLSGKRPLAPGPDHAPLPDDRPPLARPAPAVALGLHHPLHGEAVVELRHVDVVERHARHAEGHVARVSNVQLLVVRLVPPLGPHLLAEADAVDVDRRLAKVLRPVLGGDDEGGAAVAHQADVEQVVRRRDDGRVLVVLQRHGTAVSGGRRVEAGPLTLRDRDPPELFAGRAEHIHVPRRQHAVEERRGFAEIAAPVAFAQQELHAAPALFLGQPAPAPVVARAGAQHVVADPEPQQLLRLGLALAAHAVGRAPRNGPKSLRPARRSLTIHNHTLLKIDADSTTSAALETCRTSSASFARAFKLAAIAQ